MSKMTIVHGDDWSGLFIDGKLKSEGHRVDAFDAVSAAIEHGVTSVESVCCDCSWLEEQGNFPEDLTDVKFE